MGPAYLYLNLNIFNLFANSNEVKPIFKYMTYLQRPESLPISINSKNLNVTWLSKLILQAVLLIRIKQQQIYCDILVEAWRMKHHTQREENNFHARNSSKNCWCELCLCLIFQDCFHKWDVDQDNAFKFRIAHTQDPNIFFNTKTKTLFLIFYCHQTI